MKVAAATPLIFITGPSGCGKSKLAGDLKASCVSDATIVHQDDFFMKAFLPYDKRTDFSFEDDSGIDWDRLIQTIKDQVEVCPTKPLIVEGHILGARAARLCSVANTRNLVVIMKCSRSICRERRLGRRQRSMEETQQLASYINQYVWPGYIKFGIAALQNLEAVCHRHDITMLQIESTDVDDKTTIPRILIWLCSDVKCKAEE